MPKLILQPCGSADSVAHYKDTIEHDVHYDQIESFLSDIDKEKLKRIYPDGKLQIWGVTKGKNGSNRGKWDRIEVGDVTLFSAKKRIFATGVTTHKFINKELALHLWDKDDSGETWELIYFISEIKDQDIPQSVVNDLLGYDPKYVIQGFNVLDEKKSENFLSSFELISELHQPTYTPEQHIEKYVGKSLERRTETQARLEQSSLRKILLKGASKAKCAVCGNEFPEQFLVAAHIKKRANCTDEEKRDLHNIACLMCKFGCDDLYERGAIGIASGTVVILKNFDAYPEVSAYLEKLRGRTCSVWNESNQHYFHWHHSQHQKRKLH